MCSKSARRARRCASRADSCSDLSSLDPPNNTGFASVLNVQVKLLLWGRKLFSLRCLAPARGRPRRTPPAHEAEHSQTLSGAAARLDECPMRAGAARRGGTTGATTTGEAAGTIAGVMAEATTTEGAATAVGATCAPRPARRYSTLGPAALTGFCACAGPWRLRPWRLRSRLRRQGRRGLRSRRLRSRRLRSRRLCALFAAVDTVELAAG